MCIIIAKPQNAALPDNATLARCFERNPHGAGFMYANNGAVCVKKGFFLLNDLLSALNNVDMSLPLVLHFRNATRGMACETNCHPWLLANGVGFAHNGTLCFPEYNAELLITDSEQYARRFIEPFTPAQLRNCNVQHLIGRDIGTSRFALLLPDGEIVLLGLWQRDGDLLYSKPGFGLEEAMAGDWG